MQSVCLFLQMPIESPKQGIGELWVGSSEPGCNGLCRRQLLGVGDTDLGSKETDLRHCCITYLCNHVEVPHPLGLSLQLHK